MTVSFPFLIGLQIIVLIISDLPFSTSKNSNEIKGNEITHYSLKAHNGPVIQLLKTNDGLLLTSSDGSDPVIKLWDLKGLLNPSP